MAPENISRKLPKILRWTAIFLGIIVFLFFIVYVAVQLHLTDVGGSIDALTEHFNTVLSDQIRKQEVQSTPQYWVNTPEWTTITAGLLKDKAEIQKAATVSGVPARLIVSDVIVEQFRYFDTNRELFKRIFAPLQLLGNATRFSYGVAGVKIGTAKEIEKNLVDTTSPYYLGPAYTHALDYTTTNTDTERMQRLTDPNNHYYSYLYTGLFLKEIETQWNTAGHPLDNRPEVLATLFNLGFAHSIPKADPQVGGSTITINGHDYTFGALSYDFYYSNQLTSIFPN
jgi:hypothetical protein